MKTELLCLQQLKDGGPHPRPLGFAVNFSGLCEELSGHCRGAYGPIPQGLTITYTRARQFT